MNDENPNYRRDCSIISNRLEGVTTCVNYADFLDVSLTENLHHFDEFVVVTSHEDKRTQQVCSKHGVICVETDVFTERHFDKFNKGLAINLGLGHLTHTGWLLHLDSDIILPDRFRSLVEKTRLKTDCIYGADRMLIKSAEQWEAVKEHPHFDRQFTHRFLLKAPELDMGARLIHNEYGYCPIGYFQLWHSSKKKRYPHNQGSAEHTDLLFSLQWPAHKRILLPTVLTYHLESEETKMGANWSGRKTKEFKVKKKK